MNSSNACDCQRVSELLSIFGARGILMELPLGVVTSISLLRHRSILDVSMRLKVESATCASSEAC